MAQWGAESPWKEGPGALIHKPGEKGCTEEQGGHPEEPSPLLGNTGRGSPRTRFSGSLMLTVWSWEADKELFMGRSAGGQ